jgi:hypothetical protein
MILARINHGTAPPWAVPFLISDVVYISHHRGSSRPSFAGTISVINETKKAASSIAHGRLGQPNKSSMEGLVGPDADSSYDFALWGRPVSP